MHDIPKTENILESISKNPNNSQSEKISSNIKPEISVIVPTYFEESILESLLVLLDADLRKKYNFELIVSDGGSTDNTLQIAMKYADKLVTKTGEERQTISGGRNAGASVASGDVLVFLNADCKPADLTTFFEFISHWKKNSTASAIACKVKAFDEDELLRDRIFYFLHNNYVKLLNYIGVGMGRGECQVVRKDIFESLGGYNSKLAAGEDFDFYRRIAKNKNKIEYSEQLLVMESPRRFRKYGYLKTLWHWTLNSLAVIFCNKSASKEWEAIR